MRQSRYLPASTEDLNLRYVYEGRVREDDCSSPKACLLALRPEWLVRRSVTRGLIAGFNVIHLIGNGETCTPVCNPHCHYNDEAIPFGYCDELRYTPAECSP
jgi:hypothetical protein